MQPQPNADLFKTDGDLKKRVRDKFTSTPPEDYVPDEPVVAAKTTKATATPMKNERIKGLGTFTTNTGGEVGFDIAQFADEFAGLARDLANELTAVAKRAAKSGKVSLYARRQIQDKLRGLNAANERLGIIASNLSKKKK